MADLDQKVLLELVAQAHHQSVILVEMAQRIVDLEKMVTKLMSEEADAS